LINEKKIVSLQWKTQHDVIMELKEIGQIIKDRRAVLGVNHRTVSALSGIDVNDLVAIECGEGTPQTPHCWLFLKSLALNQK